MNSARCRTESAYSGAAYGASPTVWIETVSISETSGSRRPSAATSGSGVAAAPWMKTRLPLWTARNASSAPTVFWRRRSVQPTLIPPCAARPGRAQMPLSSEAGDVPEPPTSERHSGGRTTVATVGKLGGRVSRAAGPDAGRSGIVTRVTPHEDTVEVSDLRQQLDELDT